MGGSCPVVQAAGEDGSQEVAADGGGKLRGGGQVRQGGGCEMKADALSSTCCSIVT